MDNLGIKRILSVVMVSFLLLARAGAVCAFADPGEQGMEETSGGIEVEETENGGPEILRETEYEKIKGSCGPNANYSVKQIGTGYPQKYALYITGTGYIDNYNLIDNPAPWQSDTYRDKIQKIVIGEGITSTGFQTFKGCGNGADSLEVSLPSTLRYLSNQTFMNCTSLKNIYMPESLRIVGNEAFRGCTALTGMCLWGSSKEDPLDIGQYAFYGCGNLKYFSFPRYIKFFGIHSFEGGSRVVIYYPVDGVWYRDKYYGAGDAGKALADFMKLDGGCAYDYSSAKVACGMEGYIGTDGAEVTFVYDGREVYRTLRLSGSGRMLDLDKKEKYPWHQESIRTVAINDYLENVGSHAFEDMNSLEEVTLYSTKLNTIGASAFSDCSGLSDINLYRGSTDGIDIKSNAFNNCKRLSDGKVLSFITINDGKSKVKSIGRSAFSGCGMKGINLGSTFIVSIGTYAFSNCKKLESLNLSFCKLDGQYSFSGCTGLKNVTIKLNSSDSDITGYTFYNCTSLKGVKIESARDIKSNAFSGCRSLDDPEIGTVRNIEGSAFDNCTGIKIFNTGNTAKSLGKNALHTCTDLYIGKNIQSITAPVVYDINRLDTIDAASDNYWFASSDDAKLILTKDRKKVICGIGEDIVIPSGAETIGESAFSGLSSLNTVTIPVSVKKISRYAFEECTGLKKVIYKGSKEEWDEIEIEDKYTEYDEDEGRDIEYSYNNEALINAKKEFLVKSGNFGEGNGLHWTFAAGVLTITQNTGYTGTLIPDFSSADKVPWHHLSSEILTVNADFITSVGNYAFSGSRLIKEDELHLDTDHLTKIGDHAFEYCSSLNDLSCFGEGDLSGGIGSFAFKGCRGLTDLTLRISGTIKENAFAGCTRLERVNTGDGDVTVLPGAFNGCSSLKEFTVGKSTVFSAPITDTPDALEKLTVDDLNTEYESPDDNTFITDKEGKVLLLCTDKTDIPDGIETIGTGAFYNQSSMETVTIPYDVRLIEKDAFFGCDGLIRINYLGSSSDWGNRVTVKEGNTVLDPSRISWLQTEGDLENGLHWKIDSKVLKITKPDGVTADSIPDFESAIAVPWSASATRIERVEANFVTSVGDYAFFNFTGTEDIEFGLGEVTRIGAHSFENCDSLTEAKFDNIETIGAFAFAGCANLEKLCIPSTVTSVGEGVVRNCKNLTEIEVTEGEHYIGNSDDQILLEKNGSQFTLIAVVQSVDELDLRDMYITAVGASAFSGCVKLEEIILPDSVESIGDRAFEGCTALKTFTVPTSVSSMGASVFADCEKLTELKSSSGSIQADSNTLIDTSVDTLVAGCNGSTGIPDGVYAIGEGAFKGCSGLSGDLTLPDSLREIKDSAFYGCVSITGINIHPDIYEIGKHAFYNCYQLSSYIDLSHLTEVGDSAFEGCDFVSGAALPVIKEDSAFGTAVFKGCSGIVTLKIPNGLLLIPDQTFMGCLSLKTLNLPVSLKTIGEYTFNGTSLETVNYSGTRGEWEAVLIKDGNDVFSSAEIKCKSVIPPAPPIPVPGDTYTVTYKAGYDGPSDITETRSEGSVISLSSDKFTREGYTLSGWKDADGTVLAADQGGIIVNKDLTFTAQWTPVKTAEEEGKEKTPALTQIITKPVTVKDKDGNEKNINMAIEITKAVSYNGMKHVWAEGKSGKSSSPDIVVKISGGIENYAAIKSVKIENNKKASEGASKKPQVVITLKPLIKDKAVKKSVESINKKVLKKDKDLTFEILPLDLATVENTFKVKLNGKKTKIKKLTADVTVPNGTKTIKLTKKDYTAGPIDSGKGTVTITGKGNFKGTVTVPLS